MGFGIKQKVKSRIKRFLPPVARAHFERLERGFNSAEPEMIFLRHFCDKDQYSIDVGASNGEYTYELARLSKSCYAFEPNPAALKELRKKVLPNVQLIQKALSDKCGNAALTYPIQGGIQGTAWSTLERISEDRFEGLPSKTAEVEMIRLDDLKLTDIAFIKIDVEGHEIEVLKGAKETIRNSWPILQVECEERHRNGGLKIVSSILTELGYHGYFLDDNNLKPIENFDISTYQNENNAMSVTDTIEPSGIYINNFIFIPNSNLHVRNEIDQFLHNKSASWGRFFSNRPGS